MMIKIKYILNLIFVLFLTALPTEQGVTQAKSMISILTPSEGSVVSSPIQLQVELAPDVETRLRVCLIISSNFTISRQLHRINKDPNNSSLFETRIPFEIQSDQSNTLLTVTLVDEFNRPQSLRSVPLTLSVTSTEMLEDYSSATDWLTIESPEEDSEISGGVFIIKGTVIPHSNKSIYIELITDTGGVIGNAFLYVETPGKKITFDIPISYNLSKGPRDVRLVVRQSSDDSNSVIILDSLRLFLTP